MIVKICKRCNKEFRTFLSEVKVGKAIYCSKKCFNQFLKENRITKQCKKCGESFYPGNIVGKFCSQKCVISFQRKENHPQWKGGKIKKRCISCRKDFLVWQYRTSAKFCSLKCRKSKNPTSIQIRNSLEIRQWRKSILERDDYRCLDCGQKGGEELQADHIYSFSKYPRLRFMLENGQTLCKNCHKEKSKRNNEYSASFYQIA